MKVLDSSFKAKTQEFMKQFNEEKERLFEENSIKEGRINELQIILEREKARANATEHRLRTTNSDLREGYSKIKLENLKLIDEVQKRKNNPGLAKLEISKIENALGTMNHNLNEVTKLNMTQNYLINKDFSSLVRRAQKINFNMDNKHTQTNFTSAPYSIHLNRIPIFKKAHNQLIDIAFEKCNPLFLLDLHNKLVDVSINSEILNTVTEAINSYFKESSIVDFNYFFFTFLIKKYTLKEASNIFTLISRKISTVHKPPEITILNFLLGHESEGKYELGETRIIKAIIKEIDSKIEETNESSNIVGQNYSNKNSNWIYNRLTISFLVKNIKKLTLLSQQFIEHLDFRISRLYVHTVINNPNVEFQDLKPELPKIFKEINFGKAGIKNYFVKIYNNSNKGEQLSEFIPKRVPWSQKEEFLFSIFGDNCDKVDPLMLEQCRLNDYFYFDKYLRLLFEELVTPKERELIKINTYQFLVILFHTFDELNRTSWCTFEIEFREKVNKMKLVQMKDYFSNKNLRIDINWCKFIIPLLKFDTKNSLKRKNQFNCNFSSFEVDSIIIEIKAWCRKILKTRNFETDKIIKTLVFDNLEFPLRLCPKRTKLKATKARTRGLSKIWMPKRSMLIRKSEAFYK